MEHDIIIIDSGGMIGPRSPYHISKAMKSPSGLAALAAAMANPIRRNLDYQGIARRCLVVTPLPQGALPIYDKIDE
jgi:hypothetical protein